MARNGIFVAVDNRVKGTQMPAPWLCHGLRFWRHDAKQKESYRQRKVYELMPKRTARQVDDYMAKLIQCVSRSGHVAC